MNGTDSIMANLTDAIKMLNNTIANITPGKDTLAGMAALNLTMSQISTLLQKAAKPPYDVNIKNWPAQSNLQAVVESIHSIDSILAKYLPAAATKTDIDNLRNDLKDHIKTLSLLLSQFNTKGSFINKKTDQK